MTNETAIAEPSRSVTDRTLLWGRVGKTFGDNPQTAEEAIVKAGLDWDVELRKLGYHNEKGNFVTAPNNFATVRTDTDALLGTVKSRYKVFTNREAFGFADNLVHGAGAAFECGFEQRGGQVVGLTMRLPDTITVGGEDPYNMYLMMKTTHDGSGSIQVALNTVRMACLNHFDGQLRNAAQKFSIPHTQSADGKIQQAREALGMAISYGDHFSQQMEILLGQEMTEGGQRRALEAVIKETNISEKQVAAQVDAIFSNLEHSLTIPDDHRSTSYGLLNATSEYYQHIKTYRTDQSRFAGNTQGLGHRVLDNLQKSLVAA